MCVYKRYTMQLASGNDCNIRTISRWPVFPYQERHVLQNSTLNKSEKVENINGHIKNQLFFSTKTKKTNKTDPYDNENKVYVL